MAETYCGKSCSECAQKEMLNCPGCKAGPGRQFDGDCELAECARTKGHETCDTCGFHGNCGTVRGRFRQPEYRKTKQESELWQKQATAKRARILGKWLWILFWLIVPSTVADLMTSEVFMGAVPGVNMAGQILKAVCSLAYGILLLKVASEEDRYRTAGICTLAGAGISGLVAGFSGGAATQPWTLILTVPAAVIGLVGQYHEFMAHGTVLREIDNDLSGKWEVLWKWYIGLYLGMFGCIVVSVLMPLLGAIALLATGIGVLVVGILKLVYLYRTAKTCRAY